MLIASKFLHQSAAVLTVFVLGLCLEVSTAIAAPQVGTDGTVVPVFSGMITDTEGNPVDDAEVSLRGPAHHSVKTDDFGIFAFQGSIKTGNYKVRIASQKCVGLTDFRNLPTVSINQNEPLVKNFKLRKACQVELKVVDEQGRPVRCSIACKPLGNERGNDLNSRTNTDGTVILGGLDPQVAKYQIAGRSERHAPGRLVVDVTDPSKVSQQTLTLKVGRKVTGTMLCSDGEPAAGWRVVALPTWWSFNSSPVGEIIGDDGNFSLKNIGDEPYKLSVSISMGNGMSTSRVAAANVVFADKAGPHEFTFNYPSPKSMKYLEGSIRWDGKSLNKRVGLSGYSAEIRHSFNFMVETDGKDFRVGPIPQGNYRVQINDPELLVMNTEQGLADLNNVAIPGDEKLEIVLKYRGRPVLNASVVDAETGQKISRFRYQVKKIRSTSGPNHWQTDDWFLGTGGEISQEVVGPGIYMVSVLADGYAIATSAQINSDDQTEELPSVELHRGVSLSGLVVDSNGAPVDGAILRMLSLPSSVHSTSESRIQTTEAGKFTFSNLRPGPDSIRVDHPDYPFKVISGLNVGEPAKPLKIELAEGGTVYGTLFGERGQPLPNQALNFHQDAYYNGSEQERLGLFATAFTDAHGNYSVGKLPSGKVYVSLPERWNKLGMLQHLVVVRDGARQQLDLGGTTELTGILNSRGKPLANTRVQLTGEDSMFGPMSFMTTTDSEGRYTFYGAPRGHWHLYRALRFERAGWAPVKEVDVTDKEIDLGEMDVPIGGLTVNCRYSTGEGLPLGTRLELRERSELAYWGRSVAILKSRNSRDAPFEYSEVSPGSFELACYIEGIQYVKPVLLSASDIDSTIEFVLPRGNAKLAIELRNEEGEPSGIHCMLVSEDEQIVLDLSPFNREPTGLFQFEQLPAVQFEVRRGSLRPAPPIGTLQAKEVAKGKKPPVAIVIVADKLSDQPGLAIVTTVDENGIYVPVQLKLQGLRVVSYGGAIRILGPPGEYPVVIEQPGFEPYRGTVNVVGLNQTQHKGTASDPTSNHKTVIRLKSK